MLTRRSLPNILDPTNSLKVYSGHSFWKESPIVHFQRLLLALVLNFRSIGNERRCESVTAESYKSLSEGDPSAKLS